MQSLVSNLIEQLQKRKAGLYNENIELRKWAGSESTAIENFLSTLKELNEKMTQLEESLAHAEKVFCHCFNNASLTDLELKRKRQRAKEQKSKIKKKKTVQLVRKVRDFLFKKGFSWEGIDKICPITYGTKGVRKSHLMTSEVQTLTLKRKNVSVI